MSFYPFLMIIPSTFQEYFLIPNPHKTQHQKIAWGLICGFLKSWETDKLTKKIFKWVEKIM